MVKMKAGGPCSVRWFSLFLIAVIPLFANGFYRDILEEVNDSPDYKHTISGMGIIYHELFVFFSRFKYIRVPTQALVVVPKEHVTIPIHIESIKDLDGYEEFVTGLSCLDNGRTQYIMATGISAFLHYPSFRSVFGVYCPKGNRVLVNTYHYQDFSFKESWDYHHVGHVVPFSRMVLSGMDPIIGYVHKYNDSLMVIAQVSEQDRGDFQKANTNEDMKKYRFAVSMNAYDDLIMLFRDNPKGYEVCWILFDEELEIADRKYNRVRCKGDGYRNDLKTAFTKRDSDPYQDNPTRGTETARPRPTRHPDKTRRTLATMTTEITLPWGKEAPKRFGKGTGVMGWLSENFVWIILICVFMFFVCFGLGFFLLLLPKRRRK